MALVQCSDCSKEISDQAPTCVHCGAKNPRYKKPTSAVGTFAKWTLWIAVGLVTLLLFYGCSQARTPEGKERSSERFAIEYCEDHAEEVKNDPRMSPGAYRIAYGACEVLKDDFRKKWNREP